MVVLTQINCNVRSLIDAASQMYRRYACLGRTNLVTEFAETVLQAVGHRPQLLTTCVTFRAVDNLQTLEAAFHYRHRQRLRVHLRTHVITQVRDDILLGSHESADGGHRLGVRAYIDIYAVHDIEMLGCAATVRTHHAKAVCVINQEAEAIFLLERHNLVEDAQCAGHAEHTFGDNEYATALLFGDVAGACQHFLAVHDVVVTEFVFLADMQTDTVQQTSVCLGIIYNHVVTTNQRVDGGQNALVTEVKQERSLFLLERRQTTLHLFVQGRLTGHHTATHRISHAPLGGCLCIGLTHLRMVCQTEIVIQTPAQHFLAIKAHVRSQLAFQLRESKITVRLLAVLTDRATRRFANLVKNV